jgi:hypothetical protein
MSIDKFVSKEEFASARGWRGFRAAKILPCCVSAALLAGCARHYDIAMTNGERVTNVTKPILDRESGVFAYKDVAGHVHHLSAGRVVEIDPHSSRNTTPGTFLSKTPPQ